MRFWLILIFIICGFSGIIEAQTGPIIELSYSQRLIPNAEAPEPGFPEGAIEATFTAQEAIFPAVEDNSLVQVNAQTWQYTFPWNEPQPKVVAFLNDAGDTTVCQAWPEAEFPFHQAAHSTAVIHIHSDSNHVWDPATGIYVWGDNENCLQHGSAWERPAHWEFFADGQSLDTPDFSEPIGLRIHGGWSRELDQKGLRFYFDGYGEANHIDYDFFGHGPTTFSRLIIKGCRYPELAVNSLIGEGIFQGLGHLGSRFAPVSVYLNDEYWGVYNFRERIDEQFIEQTHGYAGQDYILMKDGEAIHGDEAEFYDFLESFAEPADYSSHQWFLAVQNQVDLITYIDWLFINIFGASADNGFDDNSVQLKVGNGRWQFLAWDEDDLFQLPNLHSNHFRFYSAANEQEWNQFLPSEAWFGPWTPEIQQWATMFNRLMHNSEFKALLANRITELLAGPLSSEELNLKIDEISTFHDSEMANHFQRWTGGSLNSYRSHITFLRSWIESRYPVIETQLADFLDHYSVPVELSVFSAEPIQDEVDLNWRTQRESGNQGFVLYRSIGSPDNMVEIASYLTHPELIGQGDLDKVTDYAFVDSTAAANQINYYQLHHVNNDQQVTVHNWVEVAWPLSWDGLVLNELMADNSSTISDELGEFDDWFELYNGSQSTVSLDGLYLSDDPSQPTMHRMTGGFQLAPGSHFLLWADKDEEQGDNHCGLKLGSGGETLFLFSPDGNTLIDSVTFSAQQSDVSFQRQTDGELPWTYGANPSPGTSNMAPELVRLLVINEIQSQNETTVTDEAGDYDPWLEIFNPLPVAVSLDDIALSDDPQLPWKWVIPVADINPEGHLVVWVDNEPAEGQMHTNFTIGPDSGWLGLTQINDPVPVSFVDYPALAPDLSWAQVPDGQGHWLQTSTPTPGAPNQSDYLPPLLFINEFVASNDNLNQDEVGQFEDWIEVYNPGPDPVQLGGMFLTDDLNNSQNWSIPEGTELPAGAFLLVWCDDDPQDGPLHATFKLSASGEAVGLFDRVENGNRLIDGLTYGPQTTDISYGRQIDGGLPWVFFDLPTPAASNVYVSDVPNAVNSRLVLRPSYPNPFNPRTTISFDLPRPGAVYLSVHDLRGHLVTELVRTEKPAGTHEVNWDGLDRNCSPVAAGVYLVRLMVGPETRTGRMVLIK